jgi:hypothetical protein
MMSRSGIYIRNRNDQQDKLTPKRGAAYPGTRWFYNNWDFDAAASPSRRSPTKIYSTPYAMTSPFPCAFRISIAPARRKTTSKTRPILSTPLICPRATWLVSGLLAIGHGMWGKTLWGNPGFIDFSVYPTTSFAARNEFKAEGWTGRWGYGMLWWAWEVPMYPGNSWSGPY